MMLNFTRYFLIILLNSGFHIFSMDLLDSREPELQSLYNRYDQTSQLHIEVPKKLCELYEFHKTNILNDYKGYYASKEHNNEKISDFCYLEFLCSNNPQEYDFCYEHFLCTQEYDQEYDQELFSIIKYANNPNFNSDFNITRHPHPGHSGAEIYILHGNNMKNSKIAKILRCQSPEGLKLGFLELSNSLIALSLNSDPSNIKMARIFSAGYSFFPRSNEYIFCMLLEKASGKSIKDLLHDKFIGNPILFDEVLNDSAHYLAYFHVNSYSEFIKNHKIDTDVKNTEIKDREKFCHRRISSLRQDIEFNPNGDLFFNFKDALENIEDLLRRRFSSLEGDGNGSSQNSNGTLPSNLTRSQLAQHLIDILRKFEKWNIAMEDRVITHGDMHIGNLCYKEEHETSPLHRLTMIDFSSMKRTYGAIGDPAQDVGKLLGSIWKEVALGSAQKYGDKNSMKTWYGTLCKWEEVFLSAYIKAYHLAEARLPKKSITHSASAVINRESNEPFKINIMANFKKRVYFYKLCLYAQFFDDARIEVEAKKLLFYFFLNESRLLDQVINANSANANAELKINGEQSSLQVGSRNLDSTRKDPVANPLADVSNLFARIHREPRNGHTKKEVIYETWFPYSDLIQPSISSQSERPVQFQFQDLSNSDPIQNPFLFNPYSGVSFNQ